MKKMLRQSVGIDVGKDELVSKYARLHEDFQRDIVSSQVVKNNLQGFSKLLSWCDKLKAKGIELRFVIEATGVYYEALACYLVDHGQKISVILPNRAKAFSKTLMIKTVNDMTAAESLAVMGLEKQLDDWQKPGEEINHLKQLNREREQLLQERSMIKNQLHAEQHSAWPVERSIHRMKDRIRYITKQIKQVVLEMQQILQGNITLKERIDKLCTMNGVGQVTALAVVAETSGFNLIRNKKQLTSYAGYDVVEKTSGTSVRGKPHISHKGNKTIRKAMHFPALSAIRYDPKMKQLYLRLLSKHGIKMKALVAVQRKMLVMMYTLWNKNEVYDPEYENKLKYLGQPTKDAALTELDLVRS
jgi:transposase